MRLKLIFLLLVFLCFNSGCFTPTQCLVEGSSLLVKAWETSNNEYIDMRVKFSNFIEKRDDVALEEFYKAERKFREGFMAIGIAIKSENELIQSLGE